MVNKQAPGAMPRMQRAVSAGLGVSWLCTMVVAPSAWADTWDNGAGPGSTNWSTPLNWLDNSEPANLAEPVTFPSPIPTVATVTLSVDEVAQSVTFDANYTLSGGDLRLGIGGNVFANSSATINSALIGSNGLQKQGVGTLTLGGSNTFTGGVSIAAGTLRINADARVGNSANVVTVGAGTLELVNMTLVHSLTLNTGATLRGVSTASSVSSAISVGSSTAITFATGSVADTLTFTGAPNAITGGGSGSSIAVSGPGIVKLAASASYVGNWNVNSSRLRISNQNQLGSGLTNSVNLTGGTLILASGTTSDHQVNVENGSIEVEPGSATLSKAINGIGPTGAFNKTGSGTLILSAGGTASVGTTTVSGGTLRLNGSWGAGSFALSGGTLTTNLSLNNNIALNDGGALRTLGASASATGTLTVAPDAKVVLGTTEPTETLTIGNATNDLTGGGGTSTITVTGFATGTVLLAQRSNYVGKWILASGTLQVPSGDENRFGNANNPIELAGGTLQYPSGDFNFITRPFIANGGTVQVDSGKLYIFAPTSGSFGGFTKTGAGTVNLYGPQTHGTSAIYVQGGTLNLGSDPGSAESRGLSVNVTAGALTVSADTVHVYGLHIAEGQTATLDSSETGKVLVLDNLTIEGSGQLNLNEHKLIIVDANDPGAWDGNAYTGITGLVQSGLNGGTWDGGGIVTAAPDALLFRTTLAVASAGEALGLGLTGTRVWGGETVSAADTLVMYTYAGDLNVDGTITADDYAYIDLYSKTPGSFGYTHGDINYDGAINADDYALIDVNFINVGPPFPARPGTATASLSAVPEPVLGILGFAWLATFRRRRHTQYPEPR